MPSRSAPFRTLSALALAALMSAGCEDQREATLGPTNEFLDGGTVFVTTFVTASALRYQNEVVEKALGMVVNNISNIRETGCQGTGERLFLRDAQGNPNLVEVRHGDAVDRPVEDIVTDDTPEPAYVTDCGTALRLNISGWMSIEFLETSPGLRYRIEMPLAWSVDGAGNTTGRATPRGMVYQLPSDFAGGAILEATTPGSPFALEDPFFDDLGQIVGRSGSGGFLECFLESGNVRQLGTIRLEERTQQILMVEALDVGHAYDPLASPSFATWPCGLYELAAVRTQFFGPATSIPVDVSFDCFGGATFSLGDRVCQTNLLDLENGNPCEDL